MTLSERILKLAEFSPEGLPISNADTVGWAFYYQDELKRLKPLIAELVKIVETQQQLGHAPEEAHPYCGGCHALVALQSLVEKMEKENG